MEFGASQGSRLLAASIVVGLAVPALAALARPAITWVVVGLMTLVLLRTDFRAVLEFLRRPLLLLALGVWLLLACPVLAFLAAEALGVTGSDQAGLVVLATGCAATSAPAFARLVGLDAQISIVASVGSTLLVPLTAPPLAFALIQFDLALTLSAFMARLGLVVVLPLLASLLLRRLLPPVVLDRWGRAMDGGAVWLVVLYGLAVMDGVRAAAFAQPEAFARSLGLAFAGGYGLNLATTLAFWPAGRGIALASGLLSGNRNMSLYLAVLPDTADPWVLLFLALCQFPLLLSPFLLAPLYRRLRPA